jgi:hypothetical protein
MLMNIYESEFQFPFPFPPCFFKSHLSGLRGLEDFGLDTAGRTGVSPLINPNWLVTFPTEWKVIKFHGSETTKQILSMNLLFPCFPIYFLVGGIPTPLKNHGVRQLG